MFSSNLEYKNSKISQKTSRFFIIGLISFLFAGQVQAQSISSNLESFLATTVDSIIGGTKVDPKDEISKSIVILLNVTNGGTCTGNIIAPNLILTSAHCAQENVKNLIAIFSAKMPRKSSDLKKMNWRRVVAGKATLAWEKLKLDKPRDWGDLAILKFEGDLPKGYEPIQLLTRKDLLRSGIDVTIAGYGITDSTTKKATDALRKTDIKIANIRYGVTEFVLDQREGRGACNGDTGGPAVIKINEKYVLIGISSRVLEDPNYTCAQFAIYTSVVDQLFWINQTMAEVASPQFNQSIIPQPIL